MVVTKKTGYLKKFKTVKVSKYQKIIQQLPLLSDTQVLFFCDNVISVHSKHLYNNFIKSISERISKLIIPFKLPEFLGLYYEEFNIAIQPSFCQNLLQYRTLAKRSYNC